LEHRLSTTHHQEVAQLREQQQVLVSAEMADGAAPTGQSNTKPTAERRRRTRTPRPNQQGERLTEKQTIFQPVEEGEEGQP